MLQLVKSWKEKENLEMLQLVKSWKERENLEMLQLVKSWKERENLEMLQLVKSWKEKGKPRNVTASMVLEGEGKPRNVPASKVLEGRSQHITASSSGSKNESYMGTKVDSSPNTITRVPMEKLLGGLLAPGFDEGTCISRYQSYLYRKASPRKPSPYLISKLRNYEDLHKRCGPHSKSYNKKMTRLIKNSKINLTTRCSYIVWKGSNGLGNRMISLSSVFLYAVLTDRVLLVEFWHDMSGLFCEPFPNSSWEFPENILTTSYLNHIQTYESLVQNNMANTSKWVLPSILYLNLQHSREHDKLFHCDRSQDLLRKIPALILRSDQYFVPSLFMTPYFQQELSKMFPEKGTIFHHMGRYLFHPSNKAWRLISSFYDANLAKADEKIGLQIRVFNTRKSPYQTIMASILECTLNNKLLPELDTRISVPFPTKNRTFKSVFVASLHSEYAENLTNMYWRKPTITGEIIQVYQASHEGKQKPGDSIQNMKAWSEIYLLSLCDLLVTSYKSTFGYVAQGLGGLKPWILYRSWGEKIPKPCQQALSMEPCFHYPPKSDCSAKNKVDITSVFPYMKACEDFSPGVKLVD
ncbi:Galactoside 2-alpha-L-fucosyltransferase [Quillaja saponaria]|uniref:Fucosyltransferase n=1 Tax=Quillaja saponaria TaxID=32244 RepID=A0AAD7LPP1_QUISA|nr:Galactoside 2-alpha-L-fucosyltransferase [Quillaja saponaria]